jgi:hypothetical protein
MERERGEYKKGLGPIRMRYRLAVFPFLPAPRLAGQPTFVFVTVNKARRHISSTVLTGCEMNRKRIEHWSSAEER